MAQEVEIQDWTNKIINQQKKGVTKWEGIFWQ
jgi:hypothetical protein